MDRRFKLSLLGAAFFAAAQFNGAAMNGAAAADLLPPPPIVEAPEVVQKSNTGWYLRGDISYDFQKSRGEPHLASFGNSFNSAEYDDAVNIGLGIGYQVSNNFRVDLTGEYLFSTGFHGTTGAAVPCAAATAAGYTAGSCYSTEEADVSKFKVMGNAYADLGQIGHFTPYIGAGLGGARVSYGGLTTNETCTVTAHPGIPTNYQCGHAVGTPLPTTATQTRNDFDGEDTWRFAWALHAGTAYSVSDNVKLDLGYTFSRIEGGKAFQGKGLNTVEIHDKGFDDHTVRAGLRYQFGH